MASIWDSTRKVTVRVETRGPDGVEDEFTFEVSREVYALSRAQRAHAERHGCSDDEVQVRYGSR